MNDVEPEGDNRPDEELDTTAPNPPMPEKTAGGWSMPEPTFQQTSGYLPQGYIDQVGAKPPSPPTTVSPIVESSPEPAPAAPPAEVSAEALAPAPAQSFEDEVEPQPDLNEQLDQEPAPFTPAPIAKEGGSGRSMAMVILGLAGMVIFIVVFLVVIYFLFLAPSAGGNQF